MSKAPGLEYYRHVPDGIAEIFDKYKIVPPGGTGYNVCLCRDPWNCCNEILSGNLPSRTPGFPGSAAVPANAIYFLISALEGRSESSQGWSEAEPLVWKE